jgi:hypothetical protein
VRDAVATCAQFRAALRCIPWLALLACADHPAPAGGLGAAVSIAGLKDCTAKETLRYDSVPAFVADVHHSPRSYTPLTIDEMNAVIAATRALDQSDLASAADAARGAGYHLLALSADGACDWVLAPPNFPDLIEQPILIHAAHWRRDLVIEAPHARDDHNTGAEAAILFASVGAKAVVISGSWRCVQGVASSGCHSSAECSALDRNTGTHPRIPPADSDPSHSIHNALYAAHLAFMSSDAVLLQIHTNADPVRNGDAMISNGTRYPVAGTPADALYAALQAPDIKVGSCNDPSFPSETAFCGETTTESLASNGAADTCLGRPASDPSPAAHRFIHLEQASGRMCRPEELLQADAGVVLADAGLAPTDGSACIGTYDEWSVRVAAAIEAAIPLKATR